ncbi:MAG: hypothetical protein RMJ36_02350 [Candidatus Calescibacterium sp.]|nr:hypothetical protein [Candidatus Calescibacterium sp.]MDW8132479.1 hypothetical protein [Candidatus Calescibacterium sp.]
MELFKKNKSFSSIESFSLAEYIYLLNYTNELINKYDQGLLNCILGNYSILILNQGNTVLGNYITQILLNLKKFYFNIDILETPPFLNDFYETAIIINSNINLPIENLIYINRDTFSIILALSMFIYSRDSFENKPNIITDEKILKEVDKNTFNHLIDKIINKKEYLYFLKNYQIGNEIEFIPQRELLFIILGIIIILSRKI